MFRWFSFRYFVFADIFKLVRFKLSTLCCVLGSRSDTVYSMKIKSANIYKVYDMVASAPARTGADIMSSTPCGTLVQYYLSQDILNCIRWENKSMIEMFSNAQICSIYKVIEIYRTVLYSTVQNVWHWKFFSYNVHLSFIS